MVFKGNLLSYLNMQQKYYLKNVVLTDVGQTLDITSQHMRRGNQFHLRLTYLFQQSFKFRHDCLA